MLIADFVGVLQIVVPVVRQGAATVRDSHLPISFDVQSPFLAQDASEDQFWARWYAGDAWAGMCLSGVALAWMGCLSDGREDSEDGWA